MYFLRLDIVYLDSCHVPLAYTLPSIGSPWYLCVRVTHLVLPCAADFEANLIHPIQITTYQDTRWCSYRNGSSQRT